MATAGSTVGAVNRVPVLCFSRPLTLLLSRVFVIIILVFNLFCYEFIPFLCHFCLLCFGYVLILVVSWSRGEHGFRATAHACIFGNLNSVENSTAL